MTFLNLILVQLRKSLYRNKRPGEPCVTPRADLLCDLPRADLLCDLAGQLAVLGRRQVELRQAQGVADGVTEMGVEEQRHAASAQIAVPVTLSCRGRGRGRGGSRQCDGKDETSNDECRES